MKVYKFKKAFTLVEAMILLLAASIILAATMPIISKKHAQLAKAVPHGRYICYRGEDDQLRELMYKNNSSTPVYVGFATSKCVFEPPARAAYFLVQAVGGGGGGGGSGSVEFNRSSQDGTYDSGSIPISNPEVYTPSWAVDYYETYAGDMTVTIYAPSAGKGGNYTYVTEADPSNPITNQGGAADTGTNVTCTYPIKFESMDYSYLAPSVSGCNGASRDRYSTETQGEDGTVGTYGLITVTSGSSSDDCTGGTLNGGTGATQAAAGIAGGSTSTTCTGYSRYGDVSYTTPSYQVTIDRKRWVFGYGGGEGKFSSMFITSLKRNVEMTVGLGGEPGNNAAGSDGEPGGDTYFGPPIEGKYYLKAPGGAGGYGGNSDGPYILNGSTPTSNFYYSGSGIVRDGGAGGSSMFAPFALISGISASSGLSNDAKYGYGGKGGSTISNCNSSNKQRYFNGHYIESVNDASCTDSTSHTSGYALDYYEEPSKGYGGAIIIVW